jgi:hypothetical protein
MKKLNISNYKIMILKEELNMKVILSSEEYNVLNLIASKTKMDCWFCLSTDKYGYDIVFDIENCEILTMRRGVSMLNEGIVPELIDLTDDEIDIYVNLLKKLNIEDNPFEEYIQAIMEVYDGNANGICEMKASECEEIENSINCIDVKNEWWVVNPNFAFTAYTRNQHNGIYFIDNKTTFDSKEEAIAFAKVQSWDGVMDNSTGEIVWENKEDVK